LWVYPWFIASVRADLGLQTVVPDNG